MGQESCDHCGSAVEVPDVAEAQRFACPHCGGVLGGPPPESPAAVAAPLPLREEDVLDRQDRVREAADGFRSSGRRPTTGKTDLGGWVATAGICMAVPAVFSGPWNLPLVLGLGGMGLCLIGIVASRDKLLAVLGLFVSAGCGAAGLFLEPWVTTIARDLGLLGG